jgi:hypothetical protein
MLNDDPRRESEINIGYRHKSITLSIIELYYSSKGIHDLHIHHLVVVRVGHSRLAHEESRQAVVLVGVLRPLVAAVDVLDQPAPPASVVRVGEPQPPGVRSITEPDAADGDIVPVLWAGPRGGAVNEGVRPKSSTLGTWNTAPRVLDPKCTKTKIHILLS